MERVESDVRAQGGNAWEARERFEQMIAAVPTAALLSPEQVELRRALGVL